MRSLLVALWALSLVACGKITHTNLAGVSPLPGEEPATLQDGRRHPVYVMLETEPRDDYERAVLRMNSSVLNLDNLQQFCGQQFPDHRSNIANAYRDWRKRHEAVTREIRGRSEAIWASYVPPGDMEYVPMVDPHVRKRLYNAIRAEYGRGSVQKYYDSCGRLSKDLAAGKWDLEKGFQDALAVMRQTPFPARS